MFVWFSFFSWGGFHVNGQAEPKKNSEMLRSSSSSCSLGSPSFSFGLTSPFALDTQGHRDPFKRLVFCSGFPLKNRPSRGPLFLGNIDFTTA